MKPLIIRRRFLRYKQRMRPHVQVQQKSARGFAKTFLPGSPLGLFIQQMMMKVLFRETFRGLLRRQFGAQSILREQSPRERRAILLQM
jgi:2-polyprenyl-6-methoxyphenol hydroxylase-like FAD-dependent oxidoreductase